MDTLIDATLSRPSRSFEHGEPLEEFSYGQIVLEPGLHKAQLEHTHAIIMDLDEDSLLRPFRAKAGMDAPGEELAGWYGTGGFVPGHTFGQWLSALSRYYAITGDKATRAKIHRLVDAFAATVEPSGKFWKKYQHIAYTYDLLASGLIDAYQLAGQPVALEALTASGKSALPYFLDKPVAPRFDMEADPDEHPLDHNYVIPENQLIAWQLGADDMHLDMARKYMFDEFFDPLSRGENSLPGNHAYTYVNALCSAIKAYMVHGDEKYLRTAINGFDFVEAQSFATGGWGPSENFLPRPGFPEHGSPSIENLGDSLDKTHKSFETACSAFSHFKLARYLMRITKEAKYGDSLERMMYNTVLGAKELQRDGRSFYYSDYTPKTRKGYFEGNPAVGIGYHWPCCSGSLPQVAADYSISSYFRDDDGIYVNLYIPSKVQWQQAGSDVTLSQSGSYPIGDMIAFSISAAKPMEFTIRLRIPAWAKAPSISVNGEQLSAPVHPGRFAEIRREWRSGDRIELVLPHELALKQIDDQHPDLVALCYGPLVLFGIGEDLPKLDRKTLLAAKQVAPGSPEWRSGEARFIPWWAINDEIYTTYHDVS